MIKPFFCAGSWKTSQEIHDVRSPITAQILSRICLASKKDMELAVKAAHQSFKNFRETSSYDRSQYLKKIKEGIGKRREELAKSVTTEMGKTITEAHGEVDRAYNTFEIAEEESKRIEGSVLPLDTIATCQDRFGIYQRFSIGVVFGITPFNYPLNLAAHKIAPALALGNTIVLKPPLQCPSSALILAEIIEEVGVPSGVVSVVPCSNEVAEYGAFLNEVKLLSFTGSAKVGWHLKKSAHKQKVVLELGGVAHLIVDANTNLDDIVKKCLRGAFTNAGQSCISTQMVHVHKTMYDKFFNSFVAGAERLQVGDPLIDTTQVGPLVSESAALRVEEWVHEALSQGARFHCGNKREGSYYWPTVLTNVSSEAKISCEEAFGPICSVNSYENFDDVLNRVNQTPYGLQAGLFSNNWSHIWKAYRTLEVGGAHYQ
ncbi:MAG: aldehyde dehydrogenase family protein [Deltaproteobacteria bacterium]|nr:aldehyde dehydrogenase family protein [Deltaproteobacteria bacterium]